MRVHRNAKTTVKMRELIVTRAQHGWTYGRIASLAAFGAGAIRTTLGDDQAAFWIAGLLCVFAGLSFLTVGRRTFGGTPVLAPS